MDNEVEPSNGVYSLLELPSGSKTYYLYPDGSPPDTEAEPMPSTSSTTGEVVQL